MKPHNAGFTVIEVLTGMMLLALVIFTFTPLFAFSLSQISTAGEQNAQLHQASGNVEFAQAKILDDINTDPSIVGSREIEVEFNLDDGSGPVSEYATGTEVASDSLLDKLLSFVGMNVEGNISLDPSRVSLKEQPLNQDVTVKVSSSGISFRKEYVEDPSMDKMKLVDANDNEITPVLDTSPSGALVFFQYNGANEVSFTIDYDDLWNYTPPFRVYYGNYYAYFTVEILSLDLFDLIVAGEGGKVAVASGSQIDNHYIWIYENYSIDTFGDGRTINDILWVEENNGNDERFVGVGDDGFYFELTARSGLSYPSLANGFFNGSQYQSTDTVTAFKGANFNQAVLSLTDGSIEVAGNMLLNNTLTAGQFTIPTGNTGDLKITGVKSTGTATSTELWDKFEFIWTSWNKVDTVYKYEQYPYSSGAYYNGKNSSTKAANTNVGAYMDGDSLGIASGKIDSTSYTLSIANNGRVIYRVGDATTGNAIQFSARQTDYSNHTPQTIQRCTVPATITNTTDANSVQPTAIAYGEEMFVIGMADGSIYCTDNPAATTTTSSTYYGFGALERSADSKGAINSITYVESADKWVAVGDGGLILYRDGGAPGDEVWTQLTSTNSNHGIYDVVKASINLNEVTVIGDEVFVVGDKCTILHVASDKIDQKGKWYLDPVYTYYEADGADANVELEDGVFILNTVARKTTGDA